MGLKDLDLKDGYHKLEDNVADDFYIPCLRISSSYDRAVGFFSSLIYSIAWAGLKEFVANGGKIRIICSPNLRGEDISALETGYSDRGDGEVSRQLEEDIKQLLERPELEDATRVFATLVAMGVIDLKVAFVQPGGVDHRKRLFHDKLGIFTDSDGGQVAFTGSMNETLLGLSNDGNLERVDVFLSWDSEREKQRVQKAANYFEKAWDNHFSPYLEVVPFPEVAREQLASLASEDEWEDRLDSIVGKLAELEPPGAGKAGFKPPTLRKHQQRALTSWLENSRRGIFEHCTGSGKTFTALFAIREHLKKCEAVLILVPSSLLLKQWHEELDKVLADLEPEILLCGDGNVGWKKKERLRAYTLQQRGQGGPRIVIAIINTARTKNFRDQLQVGDHLFVIADELHRLGSPDNQRLLEIQSGARLGLSATPRYFGNPEATQKIFDYFGGVVDTYKLRDGIDDGHLTEYQYGVHKVYLDDDEQEDWNQRTKKISRLFAQQKASTGGRSIDESLKLLLIQRAKIVKKASAKIPKACEVLKENYKPGQHWLVYCDDRDQMDSLKSKLKLAGFPPRAVVLEYYAEMVSDRDRTLEFYEASGGIVLAIKCLDEGVDMPVISHALVLASSKNPREFIQRRGRVLRTTDDKPLAYINDVLTLPLPAGEGHIGKSIISGELARAIEFAKDAFNRSVLKELEILAIELGLDWEALCEDGKEGYEIGEEQEGA